MKTNRLCSFLFVLLITGLLAFTPFRQAAAQIAPVTGAPISQPALSGPIANGPAVLPAVTLNLTGCGRVNIASINDAYEQRVVELTNIERAKNGQPPLKRNADLDYAARFHAKDMADDGYFAHDSFDGSGGTTKVCDFGVRVKNFFTGDGWLAENIAAGYSSPESVVDGWINSTGHHTNMISPTYREIGTGYYNGGNWGAYWVQDFGRRADYYPLIINNDAYATTSKTVSIYLYGQGTWSEMRLSNDGANWTAWQPFQTSFSWNIPCALGAYTVYAEMRAAGHTSADTSASDSIILQGSACPTFGKLPNNVAFFYDQSTKQLIPPATKLQPGNITSSTILNWSVTKSCPSADWLNLSATSGYTPVSDETLTPVTNSSMTSAPGKFTCTLTFKATSSNGEVVNTPTITVNAILLVVPHVEEVSIPLVPR